MPQGPEVVDGETDRWPLWLGCGDGGDDVDTEEAEAGRSTERSW